VVIFKSRRVKDTLLFRFYCIGTELLTLLLLGEVNRYKTKCKDLQAEVERLQKEVEKAALNPPVKREDSSSSAQKSENDEDSQLEDLSESKEGIKSEEDVKGEAEADVKIKIDPDAKDDEEKKEEVKAEPGTSKRKSQTPKVQSNKADLETIRELRIQLKKAQNEQKEMKLLLDMYKGAAKEQRDKVSLMAAERKAKNEIDELRQQLKKLQEAKQDEKKRMSEEEALKKIGKLEEEKRSLTKSVAAHKAEIDAIIEEMEVTGQAFEDMQEQNARLISQMREKDDANFKLMADRIKSNQVSLLIDSTGIEGAFFMHLPIMSYVPLVHLHPVQPNWRFAYVPLVHPQLTKRFGP
jgi:E3 ubiquitin-protein ligase BRE1